jgi:hypothetical protein
MPSAKRAKGYRDWRQVAGYFDGDGNVNVSISKFTLHLELDFTDTDKYQIAQLASFLKTNDVQAPSIVVYEPKRGRKSYNLRVTGIRNVLRAASSMLPYSFKKSAELSLCASYLQDEISGRDVVNRLNELVRLGVRSGLIRRGDHLNFTHSEGVWRSRINGSDAAARANSKFSESQKRRIRRLHGHGHYSSGELARRFRASENTILRIIRN